MSKIDIDYMKKCAELAAVHISENESEIFLKYMQDFSDELSKIDLSLIDENIEPYVYPITGKAVMREDIVENSMDKEKLLSNCADHDGDTYIVPKVME